MNKCKLCNQFIKDPIPQVGSNVPYDQQIMMALVDHIEKQHKRDDQHIQLSGMSHIGISRLSFFEIANEQLRAHLDKARWMMAQQYMEAPEEEELDDFATEMLRAVNRTDNEQNREIAMQFIGKIVNRCLQLDKYPPEEPVRLN